MTIEKAAGIIFFRRAQNKILYLVIRSSRQKPYIFNENGKTKLKPEFWDFPKGLLENKEKAKDAALREAYEETGIKNFEIIPNFKETVKYFTKRDGKTTLKFIAMFLAKFNSEKITLSWEHDKYEWLEFKKAFKKISRNEMKTALEKAHNFIYSNKLDL